MAITKKTKKPTTKTAKTAETAEPKKKAAKKKAAPSPLLTTKVYYGGEKLSPSKYAAQRAEELGIDDPNIIKNCLLLVIKGQDFEADPALDDEVNEEIETAYKAVAKDYKASQKLADKEKKEKEAEKAAKEAEKEAERKKKEELLTLYRAKSEEAEEQIEVQSTDFVKSTVAKALGGNIKLSKTGKIVIGKSANKEDIADAFANLDGLVKGAERMKDRFATYEGRLAIAAEEIMGDDWINFFSDNISDIARIKKYMKAIRDVESLGADKALEAIPLSTVRVLTESKYSDDEEENEEIKKKTIEEALETLEEKGKFSQSDAKSLSRDRKKTKKAEEAKSKRLMRYAYVIVDAKGEIQVVGTESYDDILGAVASATIDLRTTEIISQGKDDQLVGVAIEGPTPAILKYAKSLIENSEEEEEEEEEEPADAEEEEEVDSEEEEEEADEEEGDEEEEYEEEEEEDEDEDTEEEEEEEDDDDLPE